MSEGKEQKTRDYAPIQLRDLMAQMMANSHNDVTAIRGGQISNLAVLGEISKNLKADENNAYGALTGMMKDNLKWIELAVKAKAEGGPYLSQFGNDLQSLELLAGILRTQADAEIQRKLLDKYIAPTVDEEVQNYRKFSGV